MYLRLLISITLLTLSFNCQANDTDYLTLSFDRHQAVSLLKQKLNSDRIQFLFGSYGVDPLNIQSPVFPNSRISNLHSIHDGKKIMRTLAVVNFETPIHPQLIKPHTEIQNGKSIGIALRENGWDIHKKHTYFGTIPISRNVQQWMNETNENISAVHIYLLEVSKDGIGDRIHYCTICEIHSPQYLKPVHLEALYEESYTQLSKKTDEAEMLKRKLLSLMQAFPPPQE